MKRLLSFIIAISCAGFALAQDVIVLKNRNRIENVFVSGKTETEIQYIQNEEFLSIPRDSVEVIFHDNGSIETISLDLSQDPQFAASIDSLGLDINYVKKQLDNGVTLQSISFALWTDERYSQKCRTVGVNAYVMAYSKIYQECLKKAKEEGLKGKEAKEKATLEVQSSKVPIKAANEAVRECAGEL